MCVPFMFATINLLLLTRITSLKDHFTGLPRSLGSDLALSSAAHNDRDAEPNYHEAYSARAKRTDR